MSPTKKGNAGSMENDKDGWLEREGKTGWSVIDY